MNIKNLEVGMIVPNYKELCKIVEEKVKNGASKRAQLKAFEDFFEYEKEGIKFKITKVYTENDLKELEIKKGRKSLYGNILKVLLMDMLSRQEGRIVISKTKLSKALGLVNENYSLGYSNQGLMSNYLEVHPDHLKDFFETNNNNISGIINTAIKSLENEALIDVNYVTMVKNKNNISPNIADDVERSLISAVERKCLLDLGLKSINFKKRNKEYYQFIKLKEKVMKEETNFEYSYKSMDIVVNDRFINSVKEAMTNSILEEMKKQNLIEELNSLFYNNVISNAEKRHLNYSSSERMMLVRFSNIYTSSISTMSDFMIKHNAPLITKRELKNKELNVVFDEDDVYNINELLPF